MTESKQIKFLPGGLQKTLVSTTSPLQKSKGSQRVHRLRSLNWLDGLRPQNTEAATAAEVSCVPTSWSLRRMNAKPTCSISDHWRVSQCAPVAVSPLTCNPLHSAAHKLPKINSRSLSLWRVCALDKWWWWHLGAAAQCYERRHFHFSLSCIGEGNGSPLQCSCLENPRDGGAWCAAVYGVAQSWTRLKWAAYSLQYTNIISSSRQVLTGIHCLSDPFHRWCRWGLENLKSPGQQFPHSLEMPFQLCLAVLRP